MCFRHHLHAAHEEGEDHQNKTGSKKAGQTLQQRVYVLQLKQARMNNTDEIAVKQASTTVLVLL
jgi:hypothetical protein